MPNYRLPGGLAQITVNGRTYRADASGLVTATGADAAAIAGAGGLVDGGIGGGPEWSLDATGTADGLIGPDGTKATGNTAIAAAALAGGVPGRVKTLSGRMYTIGDSITLGTGLSSPSTTNWGYLAAQSLGLTHTNLGVSSSMAEDYAKENVFSRVFNAGDVIGWLVGYNNMRVGPNPDYLESFLRSLTASLCWAGVPDASKVCVETNSTTLNPAVTFTGTWSTSSTFPGGLAQSRCGGYSSVSGSTATFNVTGDTVHVSVGVYDTSLTTGTFKVLIDGVQVGAQSFQGVAPVLSPSILNGSSWQPGVLRFNGLSAGAHAVQIVTTSSAPVLIPYVAGYTAGATEMPYLYVGNCLKMSAAGYAVNSAAGNSANTNGNDPAVPAAPGKYIYGHALVAKYNQEIRRVCTALAREGLAITYVDIDSMWTALPALLNADTVHPSETAHKMFAGRFVQEISKSLVTL